MTTLKHAAMGLAILLGLHGPWLDTARAQSTGNPKLKEEIYKQESIYQGRGEQRDEGYVIDRSMLSYNFILPPEFDGALASLGPKDRWLDIGAGQGRAILDYYAPRYDAMHAEGREQRGTKAQAVAISIEDRRTPFWHETAKGLEPGKILYLFGKRLREYSLEELGQFEVITDVIGGFSYAVELSVFMEKVLEFLKVNGSFFTILQDVHSEEGSNVPYYEGSPFLTEIVNPDGSKQKVCSWLKSIACVEVSCELRPRYTPPVEVYRVRKICDAVKVPALANVHYQAGTPPERRYQVKTPAPKQVDAAR